MVVFKRLLTPILVLAAFTLIEPAAHANTISVNGSCVVGDCANPDVLPEGMMFNAPFSFTYTFANSDRYLLSGNVFGAFGLAVWHENVSNFQTTYLGNATGTAFRRGCSGGGFRAGVFRSSQDFSHKGAGGDVWELRAGYGSRVEHQRPIQVYRDSLPDARPVYPAAG